MMIEELPDWAKPNSGDILKQSPPRSLFDWVKRFLFDTTCGKCGGNLIKKGSSGIIRNTEYYRCNHCGMQTSHTYSAID